MRPDFISLLAVILGIIYAIRKLDVRRREASDFPNVALAEFERWKRKELFAYNLASAASFLKVGVDLVVYFAQASMPWNAIRVIGATSSFAWLFALIASLFIGSSARKLRAELGIDLTAHNPPPG